MHGLYFCRCFSDFAHYFVGHGVFGLNGVVFMCGVYNIYFTMLLLRYILFRVGILLTFTHKFCLLLSIIYFLLCVFMLISRYIFIVLFVYFDILMRLFGFIVVYQHTIFGMIFKIYVLVYLFIWCFHPIYFIVACAIIFGLYFPLCFSHFFVVYMLYALCSVISLSADVGLSGLCILYSLSG